MEGTELLTDDWIILKDAINLTGMTRNTIIEAIDAGKVRGIKKPRGKKTWQYVVHRDDVVRHADKASSHGGRMRLRREKAEAIAIQRGYRREELLSFPQASAILGLNRETLWKQQRAGTLQVATTQAEGMALTTMAHIEEARRFIEERRRHIDRDRDGRIIGTLVVFEGADWCGERMVKDELGAMSAEECDRILEAAYAAMVSLEGRDMTLRQAIRWVAR